MSQEANFRSVPYPRRKNFKPRNPDQRAKIAWIIEIIMLEFWTSKLNLPKKTFLAYLTPCRLGVRSAGFLPEIKKRLQEIRIHRRYPRNYSIRRVSKALIQSKAFIIDCQILSGSNFSYPWRMSDFTGFKLMTKKLPILTKKWNLTDFTSNSKYVWFWY